MPHTLGSKAAGGGRIERRVAAWLILCAHGIPTVKRWLFNLRSGEPILADIHRGGHGTEVSC
jgi:hypothetical protein